MTWLELVKDLLKSVADILRDIPVWAKTVICLLVFGSAAYLLIANAQQMFVFQIDVKEQPEPTEGIRYLILHNKSGYQTPYQTSANDIVRAAVPVRVGLLDDLGRRFEILRRTTTSGQAVPKAAFEFLGRRPLQSDVINLSVVCEFSAKAVCTVESETATSDGKRTGTFIPWGVAYAATADHPHINVPTLETLREIPPDGGYMELRLTDLRIMSERCGKDCSSALFWRVDWNGVTFFFDSIPPDATRKTDIIVSNDGRIVRGPAFGIENTLFNESGNVLRVSFYSRRPLGAGFRPYEQFAQKETPQLLDAFEVQIDLLRNVSVPLTGIQRAMAAHLQVKSVSGKLGRSRELFVGAGTFSEVSAKRQFINESLSERVKIDGTRIVGVIRPPLKSKSLWGLAVGLAEPGSEKVRLLLSENEAMALLNQLRRFSDGELKPLRKDEFFIQEVAASK